MKNNISLYENVSDINMALFNIDTTKTVFVSF